jgi:hypothetical protein
MASCPQRIRRTIYGKYCRLVFSLALPNRARYDQAILAAAAVPRTENRNGGRRAGG